MIDKIFLNYFKDSPGILYNNVFTDRSKGIVPTGTLLELKIAVWKKGKISDKDPTGENIRLDSENRIIHFEDYGTKNLYSWEIDHIIPRSYINNIYLSSKYSYEEINNFFNMLWNLQPLSKNLNRFYSNNIVRKYNCVDYVKKGFLAENYCFDARLILDQAEKYIYTSQLIS